MNLKQLNNKIAEKVDNSAILQIIITLLVFLPALVVACIMY